MNQQDSSSFSGRVVAVTGGFGTLGAAVVRAFAEHGAQVCAIDAAPEAPPSFADVLGANGLALGGTDLASEEAASRAFEALSARFGKLDILVNVAGGFRWEPFESGAIDTWDTLYRMNLRTVLASTRAALPLLLAAPRGSIVNIGANAAAKGSMGMGAYTASKSGVLRFTESLAEELKDRNVTVNAVLPTIIDTPQNRREMPDADVSNWVTPDSITQVVLFLASEAGAAITGAGIPVQRRV
jgi:NAD(P)-dependent dehydrogenase (short-subunit alcohol dehydrogenase family)